MRKALAWLFGIVGAIIAGVAVYHLTDEGKAPTPPHPLPEPDPWPGFEPQPSYSASGPLPTGGARVVFLDNYFMLVYDQIVDQRKEHAGRVQVVVGRRAEYHHVLNTDLVRTVAR